MIAGGLVGEDFGAQEYDKFGLVAAVRGIGEEGPQEGNRARIGNTVL